MASLRDFRILVNLIPGGGTVGATLSGRRPRKPEDIFGVFSPRRHRKGGQLIEDLIPGATIIPSRDRKDYFSRFEKLYAALQQKTGAGVALVVMKPVAAELSIDPDVVDAAAEIANNPAPVIVDLTSRQAVASANSSVQLLRANQEFVKAILEGDLASLGQAVKSQAGATTGTTHNSPLIAFAYKWIGDLRPYLIQEDLVDEPRIDEWINPDAGRPQGIVYFVNGMLNNLEQAKQSARMLANKVNMKVGLLYNKTAGLDQDSLQAVYDRQWILNLNSAIPEFQNFTEPTSSLTKQWRLTQRNETTRRLTGLLMRANESVRIVSHSQGCFIARNAIATASKLRSKNRPEKWISWVCVGAVMRNEEIPVRAKQQKIFANSDDYIAQGLGLRLWSSQSDLAGAQSAHGFEHYVHRIYRKLLGARRAR